jgi:hypothetical protein
LCSSSATMTRRPWLVIRQKPPCDAIDPVYLANQPAAAFPEREGARARALTGDGEVSSLRWRSCSSGARGTTWRKPSASTYRLRVPVALPAAEAGGHQLGKDVMYSSTA